jgi:hypothetical protein
MSIIPSGEMVELAKLALLSFKLNIVPCVKALFVKIALGIMIRGPP